MRFMYMYILFLKRNAYFEKPSYIYNFRVEELKSFITGEWQKASKVIHHFLSKAKNTTGDAYLLWRMKLLVQAGEADAQGELKNMKDFEIKSKTATPATDPLPV